MHSLYEIVYIIQVKQINIKLALDCMYPLMPKSRGIWALCHAVLNHHSLNSIIYIWLGSINVLTIAWPIAPWPNSDPCHSSAHPAQLTFGSGWSTLKPSWKWKTGMEEVKPSLRGLWNSPVVGNFDLGPIAEAWDNSAKIRDRIRSNANLLMRWNYETDGEECGFVEATIDNCRTNDEVLLPILRLMADNNLQIPTIQGLQETIEAFYQVCKVVRSPSLVYQEAWAIRRLIGKTKKITYRSYAPQDHDGPCSLKDCFPNLMIYIYKVESIPKAKRLLSIDSGKEFISIRCNRYIYHIYLHHNP